MIIAVTGGKSVGKSTSMLKLSEALKAENISVGGFVSKRIWKNDVRYGYELITLADGFSQLLAAEDESLKNDDVFSSAIFLHKAFSDGISSVKENCGADVVVIDEIGNIEAEGGGWHESFEYIKNRTMPTILGVRENVVVRLAELGLEPDITITVTPENSDVSGILLDIISSELAR